MSDMDEVRRLAGLAAMDVLDAIDEELIALAQTWFAAVTDLTNAYSRHGLAADSVRATMAGISANAVEIALASTEMTV